LWRPPPPLESSIQMGSTIAVLSQKGGTGKTTMVRSLADVFQRLGLCVLSVDLDPQGNLSDYFHVPHGARPSVSEVLVGRSGAEHAVHGNVIPANRSLAKAQLELVHMPDRHSVLKRALEELESRYDFMLLDCPPTLGLLTLNALVASDRALVTSQAQHFSLQGVQQALEVIELAREDLNPRLRTLGVVMNIVDTRTGHARAALAHARKRFGGAVLESVIRQSIRYAESAERGVPIIKYSPRVAADYLDLADELLERLGLAAPRSGVRELRAQLSAA
jgi:chromosome partitioning protein